MILPDQSRNRIFKFDCEINQKPEELALLSEANITCSISSIVLLTFALSFIILDSLLLITDYQKTFPFYNLNNSFIVR